MQGRSPAAHVAWLSCFLVLIPLTVRAADVPAPKRVLLLHQAGGPGTFRGRFDVSFVDAIRSGRPTSIDLYEEAIEVQRFPGQTPLLVEYLKNKYAGRQIDVIVAQGIDSFTFAEEHRALFGNPPIVTIVAPAGSLGSSTDVTGLQGGGWINGTIDMALALRPATNRIVVIDGARENSSKIQGEIQRQLREHHPGLGLEYLRDLPLSDVVARVAAASETSVVFFVRQSMRTQSEDVDQNAALSQVVRAAPVPVFTHLGQFLGNGVLGGSIWQFEADARRLAEMAKRIASGTHVRDIPPEPATYALAVDWQQLQRWNISPSRLPAGTQVMFRDRSFFEEYRSYVLGGGALVIAQGLLIATLFIQRSRRRESERRNIAILRAAPDLMFLQNRNGVYLDYHAPARECLFRPPEQFIGRSMQDVLPPEVLAHVTPLWEQALKTDETVVGEYELQIAGSPRRYEARLVRCGDDKVLSVVRDVTERARAQAALVQSEQRYSMATAAGGSGVWDWNLETKEFYVDPRLKALLGFENDEIRDRFEDWCHRLHPDDLDMVLSRVRSHLDGSEQTFEAEFRMPHKDGSLRWFMSRGSVVTDKGRPVRVVGTYTDLTERKRADEALQQAQTDLDRMSRLAAFGEFTASIAHEVSQPLTVIIINARACLRRLADGADDIPEMRMIVSEIIEAAKRADGIIRHNRELFRRHIVKRQRLDVNDVVTEVTLLSADRLRAHQVKVERRLARDLPVVVADRVQLCQVLANLVANSVDAMLDIDVKSRVVTIATEATAQNAVQVSVCDAGIGLDGVDIERMFATGYTTKPTGTGVGLSICRTIIEAHGGRIWATRNEGRGTTFRFTLPVTTAMALDEGDVAEDPTSEIVLPGQLFH